MVGILVIFCHPQSGTYLATHPAVFLLLFAAALAPSVFGLLFAFSMSRLPPTAAARSGKVVSG